MYRKILGNIGESIASKYLFTKGFTVICKNWYWQGGEIDLVAIKDSLVVFVEVKMITGKDYYASEAISDTKRRRLSRSIKHWMHSNRQYWDWDLSCIGICISQELKNYYRIEYEEQLELDY